MAPGELLAVEMAERGTPPAEDDPGEVRRFYETVTQTAPIVLFELDETGTFTRSEGRGLEALGLEADQVVGQSVFDVYADHPGVLGAVERALDGEAIHETHRVGDSAFEVWYTPTGDGPTIHGVGVEVTDRVWYEDRLEGLNDASRDLHGATGVDEVAERSVTIAAEVLEQPYAGVWLYEPERNELVQAAGDGPARSTIEAGSMAAIGPGSAEMAAFRDGELRIVEDYQTVADPAFPEAAVGSVFVVPLGTHGVLTIAAPEVVEFDEASRHLLGILGREIQVALDRIEDARALEQLHESTRALVAAGSRTEIAERTVAAAEGILGQSQSVFRLLDEAGRTLEPVAMTDWVRASLPERPAFAVGEGPVGTAFERGEPREVPRSELVGRMDDSSTETLLCVPVGDHGILTVGDPDEAGFDDTQRRLIMTLTANAESALDRIERELELERQNERLESFAEIVSHDLRNPLNVITGRLELAREDTAHLEPMTEAAARMQSIIDDVLELSRGGGGLDPSPVAVPAAARLAWEGIDTDGATLEVEAEGRVLADERRFGRLLENLLRNAVEHGGEAPVVRVVATPDGLAVEDDGPGIPEEHRESVFEMGATGALGGTGLGLAIVTDIADRHGWSVRAGEGRDGGARIEVTGVDWVSPAQGEKGNG